VCSSVSITYYQARFFFHLSFYFRRGSVFIWLNSQRRVAVCLTTDIYKTIRDVIIDGVIKSGRAFSTGFLANYFRISQILSICLEEGYHRIFIELIRDHVGSVKILDWLNVQWDTSGHVHLVIPVIEQSLLIQNIQSVVGH
jgi:hypothetical protein